MGFIKRSIKGEGLIEDDESGGSSTGAGVSLAE